MGYLGTCTPKGRCHFRPAYAVSSLPAPGTLHPGLPFLSLIHLSPHTALTCTTAPAPPNASLHTQPHVCAAHLQGPQCIRDHHGPVPAAVRPPDVAGGVQAAGPRGCPVHDHDPLHGAAVHQVGGAGARGHRGPQRPHPLRGEAWYVECAGRTGGSHGQAESSWPLPCVVGMAAAPFAGAHVWCWQAGGGVHCPSLQAPEHGGGPLPRRPCVLQPASLDPCHPHPPVPRRPPAS